MDGIAAASDNGGPYTGNNGSRIVLVAVRFLRAMFTLRNKSILIVNEKQLPIIPPYPPVLRRNIMDFSGRKIARMTV